MNIHRCFGGSIVVQMYASLSPSSSLSFALLLHSNRQLPPRYGTFSILCLIAPPVLSHLERIMGMQLLLLVCSSAYVAMVSCQEVKSCISTAYLFECSTVILGKKKLVPVFDRIVWYFAIGMRIRRFPESGFEWHLQGIHVF